MSNANDGAKTASTEDSQSAVGTCSLKESLIGIVPVRYALDDNDQLGNQLHPLPVNDKQWKGRFSSKNRNYTLRQLRDGWLYVYDDTDKTLHEYQVEGAQLTKIDWSDDEANKSLTARGTKGKVQSHLLYPANSILYIAFAHQRWTWRLCEHVRSHRGSRTIWMRKINLKAADCDSGDQHPHVHFANYLGDYVADIDVQDNKRFMNTCTPLVESKQEESSLDESTPDHEPFKHVAVKPIASSATYLNGIPEKSGIFVALDDPLADISDLFLPLAAQVKSRSTLYGKEDDIHKLQMAELTRTLGRVRLEHDELPPQVKDDPIKILELERLITDYLATQSLADKLRLSYDIKPDFEGEVFKQVQEEANEKLLELEENYGFIPTAAQQKYWQRSTVFSDEVNWKELDSFLIQYYEQVEGLDERIDDLYQDFMNVYEELGTDPIVLGLDNQDQTHLSYLLSLTSQNLAVVKQAVNTEQAHEELKQKLSLDSPKTLFALASLGFNMDNWKGLNSYVDELKNSLLSTESPSDVVAVAGAVANWGGFAGDSRIQEKVWFRMFSEPVQLSFAALQKAVAGQAYDSWRAISNFLLPSQMNITATPEGLVSNLRLVILEALVNPEAIVVHNPDYPAQIAAWQQKLNMEMSTIRRISNLASGEVTPKNHQIKTMRIAQQKVQKLLSSELPMMLMIKHEAVNNAAKEMVSDAIERSWQYGKQATQASWDKLGRMGGVVAILNLWNVSVVLQDIRHKAKEHPSRALWTNPALREAVYATGYAVSAVTAVWRDAKWDIIAKDSELLKKSLSRAMVTSSASEVAILKTFAKTTAAVSLFGLIATGLEAWESYNKFRYSSPSSVENLALGLKGVATSVQFGVFVIQFGANLLSRFGPFHVGISSIFASWMVSTLMVAGIVYLIAIVIINVFKRSELEKWLLHSSWGKEPKVLGFAEEFKQLEQIIHRPQIQLNSVPRRKSSQWMDPGVNQWELEITFPAFTKGAKVGLQITRKPQVNTFYYGKTERQSAVILNEQNGTWSQDKETANPIYSLNLGGTIDDTISVLVTIPFNWQVSDHEQLGYVASGCSEGDLAVSPAQREFATRIIEVGGDYE